MAAKRIQERTVANLLEDSGSNVIDAEHGIIRNVVICGFNSANNRRYPREVLERDCKKYENAPVNFNHSRESSGSRPFEDRGGWITNVRPGSDGRPRGDLNLYLSDPRTSKVLEAAKRNPNGFGLSHVALCHTRYEGNTEVVESIEAVESVDIVSDPATNKGLFEEKQETKRGMSVGFKIKQLAEWVTKHGKSTTAQIIKAKSLVEMDSGMYGNADMAGVSDAGPPEGTDPDAAIASGLKAALTSLFDKVADGSLTKEDFLAKVEKLMDLHCGEDEPEDEPEETPASESAQKGKGKPAASESAQKAKGKPAAPAAAAPDTGKQIEEAYKLCSKHGFKPDWSDVTIVAGTPAALRDEVIGKLKRASESSGQGAETPQSASRHQASDLERRQEGKEAKDVPPTDAKGFSSWVQE